MRKWFVLISVLVVALAMTSCLGEVESHYTPRIYSSAFYVNPIMQGDSLKGAKDTLLLKYNTEDDSYVTDTLALGDTVMFASSFYTVSNNLVSVKLDWDTTKMALWYSLNDAILKVLTDRSDVAAGCLYFNPGYNNVAFPVYFSPQVEGKSAVTLTVESDSKYPTTSIRFTVPVSNEL